MKLSVIIPVYKTAEDLLTKCVISVAAQSQDGSFEQEIILVDDGCPDESGAICDRLAAGIDGCKVIHQENGGASSARNAGMQAATGDFFTFADSDDQVLPGTYKKVLKAFDDRDVIMATFGWNTVKKDYTETHMTADAGPVYYAAEEAFDIIAGSNFAVGGGYPWNKIWRRGETEIPMVTSLFAYEDKLWTLSKLAGCRDGSKVVALPVIGYEYKNDEDSLSNGDEAFIKRQLNVYEAFDYMGKLCREHDLNNRHGDSFRGLTVHFFKILFTDIVKLKKLKKTVADDKDAQDFLDTRIMAATEKMRDVKKALSVSDFDGLKYKAALLYVKAGGI